MHPRRIRQVEPSLYGRQDEQMEQERFPVSVMRVPRIMAAALLFASFSVIGATPLRGQEPAQIDQTDVAIVRAAITHLLDERFPERTESTPRVLLVRGSAPEEELVAVAAGLNATVAEEEGHLDCRPGPPPSRVCTIAGDKVLVRYSVSEKTDSSAVAGVSFMLRTANGIARFEGAEFLLSLADGAWSVRSVLRRFAS